jgi:hypothetical protein
LLAELTGQALRRQAEAAGAAYVAVQEHKVERLERETPSGPAKQFLSEDGAMAPRVGGEWAELAPLSL